MSEHRAIKTEPGPTMLAEAAPVTHRETLEAKALRYISEGRVCLTEVGPDRVQAVVRGGDLYEVTWDPWWVAVVALMVQRRPPTDEQAAAYREVPSDWLPTLSLRTRGGRHG